MLKYRIGLVILFIGGFVFISCDQLQELLTPPMPEEDMAMPDDMMDTLMGLPMYISMYTAWTTNVTYPEPIGTGGVHGEGGRTVYINEVGAMALEDENLTTYPAGTIIVKEIMDDANTFIQKVATMKKTDDSRHNGWTYKKYARPDENSDYMQVKGDGLPDAAEGCHACHTAASVDSVFVDFSMDDTTTDDGTTTDDTMPTDDMMVVTVNLAGYTSWTNVALPGPVGTGSAHGQNARTVYINDVGAMALQDANVTAYPAGTTIVKDIMDEANTSVQNRAVMVKTDDAMYADHNGWIYQYVDINAESVEIGAGGVDAQQGCHSCHAKAGTNGIPGMDGVFVFQRADMAGEGQ